MINLELNITYNCNMACPNCNRLCHIFRNRTDHMSVEQVEKFISQAEQNGGINRLKLIGGEPLIHPQFVQIYDLLFDAVEKRIIKSMKIETNKSIKFPNVRKSKYIYCGGRRIARKRHLPILWSPKDMGIKTKYPCHQILKCGYSLDAYGYLPCSVAMMIVMLFNLGHIYKHSFPLESWSLDELCPNCSFSMDKSWRDQYNAKTPLQHTEEERLPTKTYKDKLDNFNLKSFQDKQRKF